MNFPFFILGIVIGSYINALVWRTQSKQSMLTRSACIKCKKKIDWFDNIPLLSYAVLGGKCRMCQKPISIQYPIVEMLTGVSFLIVGLYSKPAKLVSGSIFYFQFSIFNKIHIFNLSLLILLLLVTATIITIAVYDFKTNEIPNSFNLSFVVLSSIYLLISALLIYPYHMSLITSHFLTGFFLFLIFWTLVYFSKETWIGGGDAKFVFGMGLLLGPVASYVAIFIASITGSIYGIMTLIKNSKIKKLKLNKNLKFKIENSQQIPFGPFLAIGTYISLLFSTQIIDWYVKILVSY